MHTKLYLKCFKCLTELDQSIIKNIIKIAKNNYMFYIFFTYIRTFITTTLTGAADILLYTSIEINSK